MKSYDVSMVLLLSLVLLLVTAGLAYAQLNNRPYAFKNSPGGLGMSNAGKQAIINDKILGSTPDNLVRGPDGYLLDVIKGPGNVVIVRKDNNGSIIPGYRGTDFRGGHSEMEAGAYNLFFTSDDSDRNYYMYDKYQTAAIIGAWIAAVAPGTSYDPANPVTSWTVFVYNTN